MDREEKRKRIFAGLFIGFMIMTAVLTFLSKALYKYSLPVVTVVSPTQGRLDASDTGNIENSEKSYNTLIPVAALKQDDKGYYVLTLENDNGVLGFGYKAVIISVDLLGKDEEHCAVGGIPEGYMVIVDAENEIYEGEHVNYEGEKE